jgi:hypothetical protein
VASDVDIAADSMLYSKISFKNYDYEDPLISRAVSIILSFSVSSITVSATRYIQTTYKIRQSTHLLVHSGKSPSLRYLTCYSDTEMSKILRSARESPDDGDMQQWKPSSASPQETGPRELRR